VRTVACVLVVLLVLGLVACTMPLEPAAHSGAPGTPWRRTATGWERAVWLVPASPRRQAGLHPLLFAGTELILATGLPVALSWATGRRGQGSSHRTSTGAPPTP